MAIDGIDRSAAARHRIEHAREVGGALRPRVGILLQTLHHQLGQHRRRIGAQLADRLRALAHVRHEQLVRRQSAKGGRPDSSSYAMHPNE